MEENQTDYLLQVTIEVLLKEMTSRKNKELLPAVDKFNPVFAHTETDTRR